MQISKPWKLRKKTQLAPNLVLAGAQRSGTTFLKAQLATHREIAFTPNFASATHAAEEETGFPFTSPVLSEANQGLSNGRFWYQNLAERTGNARYRGTKWPYMMVWPHCMVNLRRHLPGATVVVVLRNPVEVAWSAFRLTYSGSKLADDFRDRVGQGLSDLRSSLTGDNRSKWMHGAMGRSAAAFELDRNFFAPQIELICELFPENMRHFVRFQELVSSPDTTRHHLFNILGLDPKKVIDVSHNVRNSSDEHNPASSGLEMHRETRDALEAFYQPSNRQVATLLGWHEDWWVS